MPEPILIIADDDAARAAAGELLARQGLAAESAETGAQGLAMLQDKEFGLVLLDLHLPDMDGLQFLAEMRARDGAPPVAVMTAHPDVQTAVAALKGGAWDYIRKPLAPEMLRDLVRRAFAGRRQEAEMRRDHPVVPSIQGMIGESGAFRDMLEVTAKIAAAGKVPVLIRGESGTGKEQVARAIHCQSPRAGGPWVTLNCSALPEGLLESEMFGHEKGAFTDARQMKRGLLELADGGTLFLDEIGDLALALQPKLLRAIETQTFRRLGSEREIAVDVRFVAATHRDLPAMVQGGQFREDLYYRLNVGAIDVPPLRQKQEDILPLARYFLGRAAQAIGVAVPQLGTGSEALLKAYRWPGNVRELRNVMERAAILSGGKAIAPEHLPREIAGDGAHPALPLPESETGIRPLAEIEAEYVRHALQVCHGNKTRSAELLGITRLTLRNKLQHHGHSRRP